MKTQLLEDIGQSATLSLVLSGRVSNSGAVRAATPVNPRPAFGVWRKKPDGEPVVLATQQPDQPPPPLEAPPAVAPPQPVPEAAIPASQGTVFDLTLSWPITPPPDLANRESTWFERSGQRYLLWGLCMLPGALVIQAGWWLYEDRKDARAIALVADEVKVEPQFDKAVKRRAIRAKEFTLGPDGEVRVEPAARASSASPLPRAAPAVPPLVLLEPAPVADTKLEPAPALVADRDELQAAPKPEQVAEQVPAAPLPKRVQRSERAQLVPAFKPARARVERAPDRQLARAGVMQVETKSELASPMSATLKACRAHGYHAAQCAKRACSVTKHGLVCRGK